ncbi:ABC transporter permease [Methyloceanibacter caenitepidi]|uniref:Ferric iron ABC transporter, permease protein n=1 Tax=Methyloceanibacter caenitepidi TaxID=1384459 RepID=A0A0A8K4J1_9HYPH|nr:iron ABC transporter permease [Methyloceanibacter caenitepidi]BAQ16889.1 ferric iron ABC transporter, permease protein [Methyloceanibacter caenitepidi]
MLEKGNFSWSAGALILSLLAAAPLFAIAIMALNSSGDTWPHLIENVLPGAVRRTLILMAGVAAIALVTGTGTAWLVTMYRFPGRGLFQWLLLLPLAMPTYIIAFCYIELFDYSGEVQTLLRNLFGWQNARDYWFPDIRTLTGAIFVMGAVLYPYVYITARASFVAQSVCVIEASRTLGRSAAETFWQIALPLARPALAAGTALALMETLNDIGAVEFFGVRTLTVTVYDTWLDRGSLAGAAQISCVMLLFVLAVLGLERALRSGRRFHHTTGKYRDLPESRLSGWKAALATLACALPILIGFILPTYVLAADAIVHLASGLTEDFWRAAMHSLGLSLAAAVLGVIFAVILAYGRRQTRSKLVHIASFVPAVSYAVPGTVLAIGILIPLAGLDNTIDEAARSLFGVSTGLILSGSAFAIVAAYTIRFLAASLGSVEAGLSKITRNIDAAGRTLGASVTQMLWRVHLPLLRPTLGAAALLVFVDSMKELPATLLLRPFNFDTLATQVFTLASLYRFEEAGLSALTIVLVSLVPVLFLHGIIAKSRPGMTGSRVQAIETKEELALPIS